ncbi:Formaldehyde dismutase [Planctomyces sp. SH-PL14]|nr:Formaldehyde dismutase [Planctomyces sp. SH-PL14]
MKALCWHGKEDVRIDNVPDPQIEDPRDAIIRVTSTAICGSDLHLYDGDMPTMESVSYPHFRELLWRRDGSRKVLRQAGRVACLLERIGGRNRGHGLRVTLAGWNRRYGEPLSSARGMG